MDMVANRRMVEIRSMMRTKTRFCVKFEWDEERLVLEKAVLLHVNPKSRQILVEDQLKRCYHLLPFGCMLDIQLI
ncbi:MAG: hypothetical protein M0Z65_00170 [Firmicutes bacterium]|uniref:YolD-like protein n=1 Tax=Melghirimyces thermohalophilus TaxID=1236220 RepID=A0A1G6NSX0_9BACL|nr:hypothetical protein [Melghirimyces thermohalophilus]MDA8351613.1 hypothetical protein [Bacillota bacterium]SDC70711.1 hypothetical protein SAMN04488112_11413 [Melghirimyces thermohalophilus]